MSTDHTASRREMERLKREEYRRVVGERLGIDTEKHRDPLIDLAQIAVLAGVSEHTPPQWRQRARKGGPHPMPEADNPEHPDKPLWRAVSTICPWLDSGDGRTRRWPPGSTARPEMRGVREEETPDAAA